MSIFNFLDEIFFYRTEKSGTKWLFRGHTENGKEIICKKVVKVLFLLGILKL